MLARISPDRSGCTRKHVRRHLRLLDGDLVHMAGPESEQFRSRHLAAHGEQSRHLRLGPADHSLHAEVTARIRSGRVKEQIDAVERRAERLGAREVTGDQLDVEAAQGRGGTGVRERTRTLAPRPSRDRTMCDPMRPVPPSTSDRRPARYLRIRAQDDGLRGNFAPRARVATSVGFRRSTSYPPGSDRPGSDYGVAPLPGEGLPIGYHAGIAASLAAPSPTA